MLPTLFTPISCGRAHLCWQRTRWDIAIRSEPLRFTYFYPRRGFCGAEMTSLLHFHVESFRQCGARSWPLPKSVSCTQQSHIYCSCWLLQVYIKIRGMDIWCTMCVWWHLNTICPDEWALQVTVYETYVLQLPGSLYLSCLSPWFKCLKQKV